MPPSSLFLWLNRAVLLLLAAMLGFALQPAGWGQWLSTGSAAAIAVGAILLEAAMREKPGRRIAGAAFGALIGLATGLPLALMVDRAVGSGFLPVLAFLIPLYLGLNLGAAAADGLRPGAAADEAESPRSAAKPKAPRILDTSVIIDGRIADVVETGFLEGTLVIPRFVLGELQQVADSQDPLKRARGRRGLDILQRIQTAHRLPVEIINDDFGAVREVDRKLIELAKARQATLVTNDFNLNKVASLEGVSVLNVNELANALRPVVLPGEGMRVLITKEGKEQGQGIAYLDDGTMVVVDNGRRMISRTVEVTVTSVLQTTAGKMIFARFEDKPQAIWDRQGEAPAPAAARVVGAS